MHRCEAQCLPEASHWWASSNLKSCKCLFKAKEASRSNLDAVSCPVIPHHTHVFMCTLSSQLHHRVFKRTHIHNEEELLSFSLTTNNNSIVSSWKNACQPTGSYQRWSGRIWSRGFSKTPSRLWRLWKLVGGLAISLPELRRAWDLPT